MMQPAIMKIVIETLLYPTLKFINMLLLLCSLDIESVLCMLSGVLQLAFLFNVFAYV